MNEILALAAAEYLAVVEATYIAKTWNLYKDVRDGIVYERRLDNPCEHAHSVAMDVKVRAIPFPFEYAYIIKEYMKDYKESFPDSGLWERFSSVFKCCPLKDMERSK